MTLPKLAQPYSHLRVLAHEAPPAATPEIVSLARLDLLLEAGHQVHLDQPHQIRFSTSADEADQPRACTPLQLGITLWYPDVPQLLAVHGAGAWDHFTPALTAGLGRIDTALVARALLPNAPDHRLEPLCDWLGLAECDAAPLVWAAPDPATPPTADRAVRQTAALFLALLDFLDPAELPSVDPFVDALMGPMAGDMRLAVMQRISAVPGPPLLPLPSPWRDPEDWYGYATQELEWVVRAPASWDSDRAEAQAELRRRAERDAARLLPRTLLRRVPPKSSTL